MKKLLTILMPVLFLCRPAHAEMTIQEYLQQPHTGMKHDLNDFWIAAMETGMSWAISYYDNQGLGQRLYCVPEHISLTQDQTVRILDDYLKSGAEGLPMTTTIGLALLFAMKHAFPCPPK